MSETQRRAHTAMSMCHNKYDQVASTFWVSRPVSMVQYLTIPYLVKRVTIVDTPSNLSIQILQPALQSWWTIVYSRPVDHLCPRYQTYSVKARKRWGLQVKNLHLLSPFLAWTSTKNIPTCDSIMWKSSNAARYAPFTASSSSRPWAIPFWAAVSAIWHDGVLLESSLAYHQTYDLRSIKRPTRFMFYCRNSSTAHCWGSSATMS